MIRAGLLLLAAVLLASGCSAVEEKRQAYRASESIAPLRLPDSLTPPANHDALMLPELGSTADVPFDARPPLPVNFPPAVKSETKLGSGESR